jgi:hypothetical protein
MGEADRYQEYRRDRRRFTLGQPGNALFNLVALNMVCFFLLLLSRVFYISTHSGQRITDVDALNWFALPANIVSLTERPWTILTFMFMQGGNDPFPLFIAMIGSMLWLWVFALILQDLSGNRFIFPVYIYGSLLGAVLYLIAANILPAARQHTKELFLSGSQLGTAAIAVAVTTLSPQYRIFRNLGSGIPIWVLTVIFFAFNFISLFRFDNANSFAMLGAAVAGFIFVYLLRKNKDISIWMHNAYNWCLNLFNPNKNNTADRQRIKEKIFYGDGSRQPFNKKANVTQQRVDEILDKINQRGYHFLTDEEKNILKRASEEDL